MIMKLYYAISLCCTLPLLVVHCSSPLNQQLLASNPRRVQIVCDTLRAHVKTVLPGEYEYIESQAVYYTGQQADLQPACRLLPQDAAEVAIILPILQTYETPFAVKGGGHSTVYNASNIAGHGITIDLERLKHFQLTVSNTGKPAVAVGAGWHWTPLYEALAQHNLVVVGARVGTVGVSGYLLGGGLNFYGNDAGWASNRVSRYEVVLANGTILNVTNTDHPEAFWSLKGSNLIGIVTQFELETLPQTPLTGGDYVYDQSTSAAKVYSAFASFSRHEAGTVRDTSLQMGSAVQYANGKSQYQSLSVRYMMVNTTESISPARKYFDPIPSIGHGVGSTNLISLCKGSEEPLGLREWKASLTFSQPTPDFLLFVHNTVGEAGERIARQCPASTSGNLFAYIQPLGNAYLDPSQNNDIFGLSGSDGIPVILFLQSQSHNPKHDRCISPILDGTLMAIESEAKRLGMNHPFRYRNYAAWFQDVYSSYGERSRDNMRRVSEMYDPRNVFQTLREGGHRLEIPDVHTCT